MLHPSPPPGCHAIPGSLSDSTKWGRDQQDLIRCYHHAKDSIHGLQESSMWYQGTPISPIMPSFSGGSRRNPDPPLLHAIRLSRIWMAFLPNQQQVRPTLRPPTQRQVWVPAPLTMPPCHPWISFSILPQLSCFQSLAMHRPIVLEDNCFLCHSTAVKLTLPRAYVTLIYACWHCHIGQTPFYVAVDHREKAVVICVRGTMSMTDFITDFNAHPENIPLIDPRPSSAYQAHRVSVVGVVICKLRPLSFGSF